MDSDCLNGLRAGIDAIDAIEEMFKPGRCDLGSISRVVGVWNKTNAPEFDKATVSTWRPPLHTRFLEVDARSVLPREEAIDLAMRGNRSDLAKMWNVYRLSEDAKGRKVRILTGRCTGEGIEVVGNDLEVRKVVDDVAYVMLQLVKGVMGSYWDFDRREMVGMRCQQVTHQSYLDNVKS